MIWIVQRPGSDSAAFELLAGNFPCRLVASLESLQVLARLSSANLPEVVVFYGEGWSPDGVADVQKLLRSAAFLQLSNSKLASTGLPSFRVKDDSLAILEWIGTRLVQERKFQRSYRDLELDLARNALRIEPSLHWENLTSKETCLLGCLFGKPQSYVSRDELQHTVWGKTKVSSRTVDSHLSRLRKKLTASEVCIESAYGRGYRLI